MRDYAGNHMSITRLNIKKASREQVESNMELTFDKTMVHIRKVLRKDNTRVLALLMFYDNRKTTIFMVLGSVIYFIMENYIFVDYLCCQQGCSCWHIKYLKTPYSMIFQELAFHNYS